MATYIEKTDINFCTQLSSFAYTIDKYSGLFNISAENVTKIKNNSLAYEYLVDNQRAIKAFYKSYSAFKSVVRFGGKKTLGDYPALPVFTAPPPIPDKNIEKFFRKLIQQIVNHNNYTKSIGKDMGIEAPVSVFVPQDGKPKFKIKISTEGHPMLCWKKGKYHGVEIWKNTGSGYFKLDRNNSPNYIDKSKLPELDTSAIWKYKMVYVYKDEIVGSFSDEKSIFVGGVI